MIHLHILASGSRGNAAIVENAFTGEGILIDCGICKRDLFQRAEEAHFDMTKLRAILITHEHSDHTKGIGAGLRGLVRMGITVPLYVSRKVYYACSALESALDSVGMRFVAIEAGDVLSLAGLSVHVFPTSHDAAESFGFRFEDPGSDTTEELGVPDALGFMTDTGVVTDAAHEALRFVRILALESNHDEVMLQEGPYPFALKQRVASAQGHLSNLQAQTELERLLDDIGAGMLEHIVAMHVSQKNNTYTLPKETLEEALGRFGHTACVSVAQQERGMSIC